MKKLRFFAGIRGGYLNSYVQAIFNPTQFLFTSINVAIGLVVGYLSIKGMFLNIKKTIISGLILTILTTVMAAPIAVIVFGGITGTGSDVLTGVLLASGQELWSAVFTKTIFVEIIDKILSVLIAYWVVRKMSDRFLSKQNYGFKYIKAS